MPKHAMTGFHRTGLPPASDGPLAHSDELTGLTPSGSIPIPFSHGLTSKRSLRQRGYTAAILCNCKKFLI